MKRILFFVCTLLCVNVLLSQEFLVGGVQYTVNQGTNTVTATGNNKNTLPQFLTIPETVENNGTTYTVTAIGNDAFKESNNNYHLASVVIPNTVTSIGDKAFYFCRNLYSVTIGSNVTSIGEYAFYYCTALPTVNFPNSLTSIAGRAFYYCTSLISVTIPSNVTYIGISAFNYCSSLASVTFLPETAPEVNSYVFSSTPSGKKLTVPFGSDYSSWETTSIWSKIYYKINQGEIKTLNNTFEITPENKRTILNQGVLRITQNGQLINTTSENVSGVYEIETPTLPTDKWSFVGAPFNGYKLEAIKEGTNDVSVSLFDYGTGTWSTGWATVEDQVGAGEGYFLWSFAAEPTIFTTDSETQDDHYTLNNDVVTVTKNLKTHEDGGNWLALSNPYTFKLDVNKFLSDQSNINIKGGVVYLFNGETWDDVQAGVINMTEGFFVNYETEGAHSVSFSKSHRPDGAKKAETKKDYMKLLVNDGERTTRLLFAQNDKAKQGDDIFDANKLFSPLEITEPYFVTDGVALVKEEVNTLPYTANLNIRNYQTKEVTISIDNIPEGVTVFLLDNGQDIKMNGGVEYTTTITAGENADRFQLLVKKQQRIERVKDNQITIKNNNRQITITSDITNLNIEVYNNLGQKVFATKDYNFTLDQVPAGSYVVKAFYERVNESQKIIIE
ncbi:MAG: leucine-rich repeat domain-containing protein [Bacteroidales bacterium]|nr:leucine-rich repeat domain-containing protein [Bacteroidales bacterium]